MLPSFYNNALYPPPTVDPRPLWLTLFQPGVADYAHRITACPQGFENLTESLHTHDKIWPSTLLLIDHNHSATDQSNVILLVKRIVDG